jgi:cell division GTPase FtsZ
MTINWKYVIGVGQTGSRLASQFASENDILLTFNTDERDTSGTSIQNDHRITTGGAGQNYSKGLKIWAEHRDALEEYLGPVENQRVVYFAAAGGGSGSSSIITFLNILMSKNNKILLVPVLPFIKESIPATSNATRVLNRVAEFSNNLSVYPVSNDEVAKAIGDNSYTAVNQTIIERVSTITELPYMHDNNYMTPFATDEGDHESVAYSGGFINISHDNLDPDEEGRIKNPKFTYGKISEANNVLITKHIPISYSENETYVESDVLVNAAMKIGGSAKSARVLYGVLRRDITSPQYITIATGLSIDKIFNKIRDKATDRAISYNERKKEKTSKILDRSEDKLLDV